MSICTIFNKALKDDAEGTPSINTRFLKNIIPGYNPDELGLWHPIVIYKKDNLSKYCDPLIQAGLDNVTSLDPCNCSDGQIASVGGGFYENYKEADLDSSYCGDYKASWKLYDASTGESSESVLGDKGVFESSCASGACDVRFKVDDFIAKVPVLNQSYVSGFFDFKHLEQFPACTNEGLGFERFIEYSSLDKIDSQNANFCIDWKLKEIISEIDYEPVTSYHLNEYTHNKSFLKAEKVSRTCGNFILTDVIQNYSGQYNIYDKMGESQEIPTTGNFTKPYGFNSTTHNNLFIGGEKLASHWKWNATSGILGWYRYYDINRTNDRRPIPGVDLYISQGDVFWAETDGPEPDNPDYNFSSSSETGKDIKNCPSGLKVVENNAFKGIIPNGSEAVYISENIYPKFYQFYEKYTLLGEPHKNAFRLASIMATSPLYDGYTVDLLSTTGPVLYDELNEYKQVDLLSKNMLQTTHYESIDGLYYIKDNNSLVDTLFHKYGGYLWIPPQTNETIKFSLDSTANSIYFDMDFDMVVDKTVTENAGRKKHRRKPTPNCSLSLNPPYNIYYDQKITAGQSSVSTNIDDHYRFSAGCSNGTFNPSEAARYANVALNDKNFVSTPVMTDGSYTLSGVYSRISLSSSDGAGCNDCNANSTFYLVKNAETALCTPVRKTAESRDKDHETFCFDVLSNFLNNSEGPGQEPGQRPRRSIVDATDYHYRRYKSLPFNPHIDLVAFHQQGGIYFNSSVFGQDRSLIFDSAANNNQPSSVSVSFNTKDVGIKIYSLYVERLQSSDNDSIYCKRFPIDFNNTCKCYGLNLARHNAHPYSCEDGNTPPAKTYSSVGYYIPNLSTQYSPRLRAYGGYTSAEIKSLFGIDVPEAGVSVMPIISDKLDPENPYACPQTQSIQLGNYTVSKFTVKLENFSTYHADIYASVSEAAEYSSSSMKYVGTEGWYGGDIYEINPNWKRFVNKVNIGDKVLYNNQRKVLFKQGEAVSSNFEIKLTNPYLLGMMGGSELTLQPPNFDQGYAGGGVTGIFSGRGDELSTVNITFEQKPRKQLLTFKFNPQQGTNLVNFTKENFDAEYGLQPYYKTSPDGPEAFLDNGAVNYSGVFPRLKLIQETMNKASTLADPAEAAEALIEIEETNATKPNNILSTPFSPKLKDIFNTISFFDIHRKPRLYLKRGGCWYMANLENRGGFEIAGKTYIGKPRFYEYIRHATDATYTGCIIPGIPKKPIYLKGNSDVGGHLNDRSLLKGTRTGRYKFKLPGAAPYFRARETRKIHEVSQTTIESYVSSPKQGVKFKELISLRGKDGYYIYTGPHNTDLNNYIFIGNNPDILENNTNLEIDYTNVSSRGLVYNTTVDCRERVKFQANADSVRDNFIIKKSLLADLYDDDGRLVDGSYSGNKTFRVFTEFTVQNPLPQGYDFLDFENQRTLIYDESPTSTDTDALLDNEMYQIKWGDLLKYDGYVLNNPFIKDLSAGGLPKTEYENLLYKIIVNDKSYKHLFISNDTLNMGIKLVEQVNPYFFIRQKYNLGEDSSYSDDTSLYQNYLPVLEVILDSDKFLTYIPPAVTEAIDALAQDPENEELIAAAAAATASINLKYNIYHSALFNHYSAKEIEQSPQVSEPQGQLFITDIQTLESAYMPNPNGNFYAETFTLRDPLFFLDKTRRITTSNREGRVISPTNMDTVTNSVSLGGCFNKKTISRESAFYREKVYADMDKPKGCGPQKDFGIGATCIIKSLGDDELHADFKAGIPKTLTYDSLPSSVEGFISYEGGLYNPLGDTRFTQIVRTELPDGSILEDGALNCLTTSKIPNYKKTMTSLYQNYINNNQDATTHSETVKNMDLHANEMLFRILYGEKYTINRKQLFVDTKPLTKIDLLSRSSPSVKAKDIYNEILFNYDTTATAAIAANGSYTINGMRRVGDSVSFTLGGTSVNLAIAQEGDNIVIEGNVGNQGVSTTLYAGRYLEKSLVTQLYNSDEDAPEPPAPADDETSISLVSTRQYIGDQQIRGYGPPGLVDYKSGGDWNSYPIDGYTPAISHPSRYVRAKYYPPSPCHPGTKPGDAFTYGYCRVDEEAKNCDDCELYEDTETGAAGSVNFQYSFEDCSKSFTLFGHSYRERFSESDPSGQEEPIPEDIDPGEMPNDTGGGGGGHITYGCHPESGRGYQDTRGCGSWWLEDDLDLIQKVYVRTKTLLAPPYESLACPGHFFTVNFTNRTLTVVLPNNKASRSSDGTVGQSGGSKTYCVDLAMNGCPSVNVSLPDGYTISENLNTSCDNDCTDDARIGVPRQSRNFSTKTYTAVCPLGSNAYGNIQGGPNVTQTISAIRPSDGRDDFGRAMPPCYGNAGGMMTLCDGSGAPWLACHEGYITHAGLGYRNGLYNPRTRGIKPGSGAASVSCSSTSDQVFSTQTGAFYTYGGATSHLQFAVWKNRIKRGFNRNLAVYGYYSNVGVGNHTGNTAACQIVTDIPEDEIFEGVVPGSCELKFYEYTKTYGKVRQAGVGNTEFGTYTITYSTAYIEYKYRTTDTISSLQSAGEEDGGVVFGTIDNHGQSVYTNNPISNCTFNQFPNRFLTPEYDGYLRPSATASYITTTPMFSKDACDDGVGSYNSYDELQTICGYDDWQCWAANTVYPNKNGIGFLNRQNPDENWV